MLLIAHDITMIERYLPYLQKGDDIVYTGVLANEAAILKNRELSIYTWGKTKIPDLLFLDDQGFVKLTEKHETIIS